jgi:hypothetical protein
MESIIIFSAIIGVIIIAAILGLAVGIKIVAICMVEATGYWLLPKNHCTYPACNCPFDAPADPNWCARGYPHKKAESK